VGKVSKGLVEDPELACQRGATVNVAGRPDPLSDLSKRDLFAKELAAPVFEIFHLDVLGRTHERSKKIITGSTLSQ
jgi:hypothetical protein